MPLPTRKALASTAPTASTRLIVVRRLITPSTRLRLSSTGAPLAPKVTLESIARYPASLPLSLLVAVALASVPPRAVIGGQRIVGCGKHHVVDGCGDVAWKHRGEAHRLRHRGKVNAGRKRHDAGSNRPALLDDNNAGATLRGMVRSEHVAGVINEKARASLLAM